MMAGGSLLVLRMFCDSLLESDVVERIIDHNPMGASNIYEQNQRYRNMHELYKTFWEPIEISPMISEHSISGLLTNSDIVDIRFDKSITVIRYVYIFA